MFFYGANELFHHMMLNNASPMLLIHQQEGRILGANKAASVFYGQSNEQLHTLCLGDISQSPDALAHIIQGLSDLDEETGIVNPIQSVHLCAHQTYRYVEISPSAFEHENTPLLMLIIRDITKRVSAEQHLQALMCSLQRSKDQLSMSQRIAHIGSWEWDVDQDRIFWSEETYRIYGLVPGEPIDYAVYEQRIHPDDRARTSRNIRQAMEETGSFEHYHRLLLPDGTTRVVFGQGHVVKDDQGHPTRLYGTCHDVTRQQQLEEKLVQYTIDLEESHRSLEQFACVASHDLKEPLRKINAFSDRLLQRYGNNLDERGQDYVVRIRKASERMSTLVEDLLSFSKLRASEIKSQEVDLNLIVEHVLDDLDLRIEESNAIVEVDKLPVIMGDPLRLRQLFQNLLANALKFTAHKEQPHIQLRARAIMRDRLCNAHKLTNAVELRITDNGVGFDPHHAERLFAPFQRLHDKKQYSGTGMGLAICRTIAEQHRGHIYAEGAPNMGATFVLHLPCEDTEFLQNSPQACSNKPHHTP